MLRWTPREIEWALTAFAATQRQAVERLDALAWLTGQYVAIGVNAPQKYPQRPEGVASAPREMSDEAMKQALLAMAQDRRKT